MDSLIKKFITIYIKKTGSALGWHIKDGARLFYTDKMEMVNGGEKKNIHRVHCLKNTGEKKESCFEGRKDGDAIQKKLFFFFCNSLHAYIQNVRAVVGNSWTVWVCYITLIRVEEMLSILFVVIDENFILLAWGVRITSLHGP